MKQEAKKFGQIGDYWLTKRPNSPVWYRTWYERTADGGRITRQKTLRKTDPIEAQLALAEWLQKNRGPKPKRKILDPSEVSVRQAVLDYYDKHASKLGSSPQAKYECGQWCDYFETETIADLTPEVQAGFTSYLLTERNLAPATIDKIMGVGRAAFNRLRKSQKITWAPYIPEYLTRQQRLSQREMGARISVDEAARLFEHIRTPHIMMFCMIAACTLARPGAVQDATTEQFDEDNMIFDLNPAGRLQNKKFRPMVKIPKLLVPWLKHVPCGHYVSYFGKPAKEVRLGFNRAVDDAKLNSDINRYSFRHTLAFHMRRRGVPGEQIQYMLGHKLHGQEMTERYAPYQPDYCAQAVAAIEEWFDEVQARCRRRLIGEGCVEETMRSLHLVGWVPLRHLWDGKHNPGIGRPRGKKPFKIERPPVIADPPVPASTPGEPDKVVEYPIRRRI